MKVPALSESRAAFATSLALLLFCYVALFVSTWAGREYITHMASALFPLGVCCYITLFVAGILIPQPAHFSRAPLLVFCAAFATIVFCLLCPLWETTLRMLQTDLLAAAAPVSRPVMQAIDSINPDSRHLYQSPLTLQVTFLEVVAPVCHLVMLAAGSVIPGGPSFYRSPLLFAGIVLTANPLWCIPILHAAHKMDGENAMLAMLYVYFYAPLGIYMLLFGAAQLALRLRSHAP